jgi:hypothetical protein
MLQQDARLKRPITLHVVGVTLDDLLHNLSTKDLILSADRSCGSQKLQIRLNGKPLSVLMQSLSQLLSGSWKANADRSGYVFAQTPETVARRARWWQLFLQEQEPAKKAQHEFILARMQARPVLHRIYYNSTSLENQARQEEVHDLAHQQFFRDLPPALQTRIADQMPANFNAMVRVGSRWEADAVIVPLTELPKPDQDLILNECAPFFGPGHAEPDTTLVQFNNFGDSVSVKLWAIQGKDVSPNTDDIFGFDVGLCPDAYALPLHHDKLAEAVKKMGDKAPPVWKELTAYQTSRVWPDDPPHALRPNISPFRGAYRADVLDWLADHTGIEFVADYYAYGGTPLKAEEKRRPVIGGVKEKFDALARDQDVSWRRTGEGIYLVRNNRWYRDDRLEVPDTLLQGWLQQMEALKVDPPDPQRGFANYKENPVHFKACLDWAAGITSKLTDGQILTGLCWAAMERPAAANPAPGSAVSGQSAKQMPKARETVYPFMVVSELIETEPGTLRFYASLDVTQRAALIADRLPLSSLSPAQQQQVRSLAPIQTYLAGNQATWLGAQPQEQGYVLFGVGDLLPFPWYNLRLLLLPAQ